MKTNMTIVEVEATAYSIGRHKAEARAAEDWDAVTADSHVMQHLLESIPYYWRGFAEAHYQRGLHDTGKE